MTGTEARALAPIHTMPTGGMKPWDSGRTSSLPAQHRAPGRWLDRVNRPSHGWARPLFCTHTRICVFV